ncbi:pentatricopeptide repeat-containing protein At5g47360 [Magnolia sinica]|uniref:pentatricopeptide repeat-containing protein At5g47360 n=1 Tax=Magnolia sinica TaxID=86752 RepID=UPI002658C427|nr:pentatricopeptide repeat-containing protein At5g47360 [Magnolia sinica]
MKARKIMTVHPISPFFTTVHHHSNTPSPSSSSPSKHSLSTAADSYLNLLLQGNASQTLPPLEKTLSQIKQKLDSSSVETVLRNPSTVRPLALRFFVWAGHQPNYRHTALMYSKACEFLEIAHRPQTLTDLLEAYRVERCPVSVRTFKIILNLCREAKLADQALGVLKRMGEFNCRPDTASYNVVIRLFVEKKEISMVEDLVEEMALIGLYPDVITCIAMIKGFCNAGRLEDAWAVVRRMRCHGCIPNVAVYSALLDGACRSGSLETALELLEEMEKEKNGCEPNVVTYTSVIQRMFEKGRVDEALTVLDRMREKGCAPNWVTISTVINGLCMEGWIDDAYRLIEKMVAEGSCSSDRCYSSLTVSLLRMKALDEAEKLVRRMLDSGVTPDGLASGSLIKDLCLAGRALDGFRFFHEVEKVCGLLLDSDVYSVLVAGLCRQGHLVEAAAVVGVMVARGIRARAPYIDGVVEELKAAGDNELALHLLGIGG